MKHRRAYKYYPINFLKALYHLVCSSVINSVTFAYFLVVVLLDEATSRQAQISFKVSRVVSQDVVKFNVVNLVGRLCLETSVDETKLLLAGLQLQVVKIERKRVMFMKQALDLSLSWEKGFNNRR